MNILIDTSIFIWYISKSNKLSEDIINVIKDKNNKIFLSVVSLWEISIKYQIGKIELNISTSVYDFVVDNSKLHNIVVLPLDKKVVKVLSDLPLIHKDPFDRILICQAIENDLFFMTSDEIIKKYDMVKLI